jgi:hypothetical protein
MESRIIKQPTITCIITITNPETIQKSLSHSFIQEVQNKTFVYDQPVVLEDLFKIEKIKIYNQFMEELGREACSIRNILLTLKYIIKSFVGVSFNLSSTIDGEKLLNCSNTFFISLDIGWRRFKALLSCVL